MTPPAKTILILAANPTDTAPLRLDREVREIGEGLARAVHRDRFELKQQWAARPLDVRRAMLDHKPSIVHFCGHGEGEAGIALETDDGDTRLVGAEALAGLFKLFSPHIECVLLNACYSEVQAAAVSLHIPYVIGMNQAIGDQAAMEFAVAFYDALGAGESYEFAHELGCNAIRMAGMPEHLAPVIKVNKALLKRPAAREHKDADTDRNERLPALIQSQPYRTVGILILALSILAGVALALWLGGNKTDITISGGEVAGVHTGDIYITKVDNLSPDEYRELTRKLDVTDATLQTLLDILGQKSRNIDPQDLDKELQDMAQEHKTLLARLCSEGSESRTYEQVKQGNYESAKKLFHQTAADKKAQIQKIAADDPASPELDELRLQAACAEAAQGHLARIELNYEDALRYFERALALIPSPAPNRKLRLARADYLDHAGWMNFKLGSYAPALEKLQAAKSLCDELLDAGDPAFNRTYNRLAETYREAGEFSQADDLYDKLIQGLDSRLAYVSGDTKRSLRLQKAEALNNLGQLHSERMNEYQTALTYYQESLDIRRQLLEPDAPEIAESLNNIGSACHYRKQYEQALEYYRQALAIKRKRLRKDHPSIAFTLHNIGVIYSKLQRYDEAGAAFQEALQIKKDTLGKQHKSVAATYQGQAQMAQAQGDFKAALVLYQDAIAVREKNLGPEHAEQADGYFGLATLFYEQQDYAAAAEYFGKAARILEKSKGYEQSDTLDAFQYLSYALKGGADRHLQQNRYAQAIALYEEALDAYQRCCLAQNNDEFVQQIMSNYIRAKNSMSP